MSRLPRPAPGLGDYLREQRRRVRQQGYSSAFTRSGMNVTAEGVTASDDFDGDISQRDAGTTGWALGSKTVALGDPIFRARSIGDDSLSSLVGQGFTSGTTSGWALTPDVIVRTPCVLTVPDGFTGALVSVTVSVSGINSTASGDVIYASTSISAWPGDGWGGESLSSADAGKLASTSASGAEQYTGLSPGDTITCAARVHTNSGTWSASGFNIANVNALAIWFR